MTQRAHKIELQRYGSTPIEAVEKYLKIEEMPVPDIGRLGPRELAIKIHSSSINFVDLIMMTGQYQHMAQPPYVPGLEFSGEVVGVGNEVSQFKPGDRVLSDYMAVGPRSKGDYQGCGGWASYAIAPVNGVHPLPDEMSFDEGCCLLANSETAYFALAKRARLIAGETVLITGASGAAGMAAIQTAKILGATVIVSGRSEQKLAHALAHGADFAVQSTETDDSGALRGAVKDLTDGNGVDVVYDTVGGEVGYEALRSLRFGGRYVIVGWSSNVAETGGRDTFIPDKLPTNIIQMKCLEVLGSPMVIFSMQNPEWRTQQINQVMEWARAGRLKPYISHRYPLDDFKDAAIAKFAGKVTGSCVINPS
jgi:NADPH2:quinone reductase